MTSSTTGTINNGNGANVFQFNEATPLLPPRIPLVSADPSIQLLPNDSSVDGAVVANTKPRSWWSRLTFQWFTPLLYHCNEFQKLLPNDLSLVPLQHDCRTDYVHKQFQKYWQNGELQHHETNPSLIRALVRAYGRDFIAAGLLKLCHDLCVFVGPIVLKQMVLFLRQEDASVWIGLRWTLAVTFSQTIMSVALRHYFFKCYVTGLRLRTALTMAVYYKALTLSSSERQNRSLGEITNLMSLDSQRLQDLTTYLHALWSSPLQICLALYFLWRQLGPSSLGGVAVILIMIPVTKTVAGWMGRMQKRLMNAKDRRVELNSEVLQGMKVIKLQAWEEAFAGRILALRETELALLFRYYVGTSFSRMLWTFTPLAVAMATFLAYVLSGHKLDVASALTSLTLFDILRFPLFMLPNVINNTVEALVSIKRLRSFLLCDEHKPISDEGIHDDIGVQMRNVYAVYDKATAAVNGNIPAVKEMDDQKWQVQLLKSQLEEAERKLRELSLSEQNDESTIKTPENNRDTGGDDESELMTRSALCLKGINFDCKPGEFVVIVGGVGCGKSSFLNAILGEVRQLMGYTAIKGKLAYFPQIPFIMNATVRENILFGHINDPINEALYQRALDFCSLRHDLELLPDGDSTEIGEKGITLSGGQKARIALARAVYHRADVTLIDDALSAVDAHVATELFERTIVGELLTGSKNRCVVLVTNAIQYLNHPRVDRIIVLRDGYVVEQGSYKELVARSDSVFSRFLWVMNRTGVSGTLMEGCSSPSGSKTSTDDMVEELVAPDFPSKTTDTTVTKKLMTEERREKGHVEREVYLAWFRAAGGIIIAPVVILISFAMGEGVQVLSNWWLTYWSAHGDTHNQSWLLMVYSLINLASVLVGLGRMLIIAYLGLRASRKLYTDMLKVVLHGRMSFFDTTPVGRLINRFSGDIYVIDEQLTTTMRTYLATLFSVFSTFFVVTSVTPIFAICLIPLSLFYLQEQKFFTLTYRELKRLDSVSRSPIYALLSETVDGVAVVRAFSAEGSLKTRLRLMLDKQQHAYFLTCAAQSWLAVRLELIGTSIITFACLSAVIQHITVGASESFAGLAGLSISYSLSVTQSLNWSVRMASDMEANFVAVERIKEYTQIENEGARRLKLDDTLPEDWPLGGEIVFENAKLRYRPGLPLVLKGLDIRIPAGCKVGVVGRTGAGKSTLMVALMRIVELSEGRIFIDGKDTKELGLAKLRSSIAVIPQDPVLFSGTLRSNLDPFDDFRDEQLYETLEKVGMYKEQSVSNSTHNIGSLTKGRVQALEDEVSEGGSNFSVGQRQLIVIARALLHGARIVIMDEATASVDSETDAAIQVVMRKEFTNATCITVAHRIKSILDSDYILVMNDGKAAEFDKTHVLLQKGGMFRDLVNASTHESPKNH